MLYGFFCIAFEARAYYTDAYFELFAGLHKQLFDDFVASLSHDDGFSIWGFFFFVDFVL
jgi:hypothetical protein